MESLHPQAGAARGLPCLMLAMMLACTPAGAQRPARAELSLAYAEAGLDERQAAEVLLDRLTFGARPEDVEHLLETGLSTWVTAQMQAGTPDPELDARLARYAALTLDDDAIAATYPTSSMVSAHARRFHDVLPPRDEPVMDSAGIRAKLDAFSKEQGFRDCEADLLPQLRAQKLVRAVHAQSQLREVLTDFWQNHFFTGVSQFGARTWVLSFEQNAIRPHVLGRFGELLHATAKHAAMREYYLRDAETATLDASQTTLAVASERLRTEDPSADTTIHRAHGQIASLDEERDLILKRAFWPDTGPNLAWAHALLELHTLGPDGAYSEADVREVARAFTGWTVRPRGATAEWFDDDLDAARALGFVQQGGFLFRADEHDAGPKRLLGLEIPPGGGVEEGERVLDSLAAHPDTARHIARKLAVRFAGDAPSELLVDALARTYLETQGSVRAVLETLLARPEFWRAAAQRQKVKPPFAYTASALRALDATLEDAEPLARWTAELGQPLYGFLTNEGVPESNAHWLDPASLLQRIRFADALAHGRIEGVGVLPASVPGAPDRSEPRATVARIASPGFQLH